MLDLFVYGFLSGACLALIAYLLYDSRATEKALIRSLDDRDDFHS